VRSTNPGAALAGRRRDQTVAAPILDLPRDPDFAFKAGRVLDLYARTFDGEPLGDHDYVNSAAEKPGVQARQRIHPSHQARPGRQPIRVEAQ
jgi:hypothetical protein